MTALVVRFRKPTDWADSVHIHYWNTRPHEQGSTWPGVPMEQVDGWLAHRFAGVAAASFVFNDCQSRQSGDLHRDRNGWYTEDGQWYNQPPQSAVAAPGRSSSRPEPQAIPQIKAEDTRLPDFHEETIYFLLTARFYDGDPSNNFFCRDRIRFDTAGKATDPHWRGDFKGLIQRLDYIRDLGFSAIWITPPIENRSGLDYHGYNRTRIDPRLESPDARYRDLIDAVHARSIKIIQDYVPHGSEPGRGGHGPYQGNLGNHAWPNRDNIDNPVTPAWYRERHARDPEGTEPPVDPKPGYDPSRFFSIDANTLKPEWYHQEGFICGGDWESAHPLQHKHLASDCIDLATERENIKAYIIGNINRYLDMGVDALRIDTVKHIERDNLSRSSFEGIGRVLEMDWSTATLPSSLPPCRTATWARTMTFASASRANNGWRWPPTTSYGQCVASPASTSGTRSSS